MSSSLAASSVLVEGNTQHSPLHMVGRVAMLHPCGNGSGRAGGHGAEAAAPPAHLQEAAQRCLREVSGSLDDVIGLAALKQELRETVLLPLHAPHLFVGLRRPQSNCILHGLPGEAWAGGCWRGRAQWVLALVLARAAQHRDCVRCELSEVAIRRQLHLHINPTVVPFQARARHF